METLFFNLYHLNFTISNIWQPYTFLKNPPPPKKKYWSLIQGQFCRIPIVDMVLAPWGQIP